MTKVISAGTGNFTTCMLYYWYYSKSYSTKYNSLRDYFKYHMLKRAPFDGAAAGTELRWIESLYNVLKFFVQPTHEKPKEISLHTILQKLPQTATIIFSNTSWTSRVDYELFGSTHDFFFLFQEKLSGELSDITSPKMFNILMLYVFAPGAAFHQF